MSLQQSTLAQASRRLRPSHPLEPPAPKVDIEAVPDDTPSVTILPADPPALRVEVVPDDTPEWQVTFDVDDDRGGDTP